MTQKKKKKHVFISNIMQIQWPQENNLDFYLAACNK